MLQSLDTSCDVCGQKYENIGHPLKPGVIIMRVCGCKPVAFTPAASGQMVALLPEEVVKSQLDAQMKALIKAMACRICSDPCASAVAILVNGSIEFFPGWCERHSADVTRPLTTPVT